MPRIPSTNFIGKPKSYGYDARLDTMLLRTAIGPGREMTIQSSDVQEQGINVKQNAEDFTSNLGRIYSRNNFTGGQGLDTAHRANGQPNDSTRFWDSRGIDVFHGEDEVSYNIHLLHNTTSLEVTGSNLSDNSFLVRTNGDSGETLWLASGANIYASSNGGTTWTLSLTAGYDITGMAPFGGTLFITAGSGTNTELQHYDGSSWTNESLGSVISGYLNNIFVEKGFVFVAGVSNGTHYLWHADPIARNFNNKFTTASSDLVVTAEAKFTSAADAGAVVLVSNENGKVYSIKDNGGTPQVKGQSKVSFEKIFTIAATEGIIFLGTQEATRTVGRLYRAQLVVADDLYVLANRQLIKEWFADGVDTTPYSMFVSRDSVYMGVCEASNELNLWRYYLPTGGLARDLLTVGTGKCRGITQSDGMFLISVSGHNVFKEQTTYESTGYIISSAADFYTAERKQFVGAAVSTLELPSDTDVELRFSNKFEDLDNPDSTGYKLGLKQNHGAGDAEKQITPVARYIIGKLVLNSHLQQDTPKVKSFQFRALARPELVVVRVPINISDRVERPNRKPLIVKGLGDSLYNELRGKEGDSITLELFDPAEVVKGVVENLSYPITVNTERGSVTTYAVLTVRGTRVPIVSDVSSRVVFGIETLGVMRFGG
jgi:hypothetical protein